MLYSSSLEQVRSCKRRLSRNVERSDLQSGRPPHIENCNSSCSYPGPLIRASTAAYRGTGSELPYWLGTGLLTLVRLYHRLCLGVREPMPCNSGLVPLDHSTICTCYRCERMQVQSEVAKYCRQKQGKLIYKRHQLCRFPLSIAHPCSLVLRGRGE